MTLAGDDLLLAGADLALLDLAANRFTNFRTNPTRSWKYQGAVAAEGGEWWILSGSRIRRAVVAGK